MNACLKILGTVVILGMIVAGCSGGGSSANQGNTISGTISLGGDLSTAKGLTAPATALEDYESVTIQLVDSTGAVVDETTTDSTGTFSFSGVRAGDYTIIVIDRETGLEVTQAQVTVIDGDNVDIDGVITSSDATWSVTYEVNPAVSLQNETQTQIAQNIADASGLTLAEVIAMRQSGMGWGTIAIELGVHPGNLGIGNTHAFDTEFHTGSRPENVGHGNSGDGQGNSDNAGGGNPHY
ncbi:MAG: carboxypeptidase regulatory-like domain-containing protein [Nitrospinae bacterium]|nr:carboxypeptidase regulatory-like domain-containing protein [Nitrospinota bacterium]